MREREKVWERERMLKRMEEGEAAVERVEEEEREREREDAKT